MPPDDKPRTNQGAIFVVICTIAFCAVIGVSTLSYCLIYGIEPNQTLLTVYSSLVIGLFGYLSGVLSKTSPTEATKSAPPTPPPADIPPIPPPPTKVVVENKPDNPVQTEEVKP